MNPWEEDYATPDGGPAPWEQDYDVAPTVQASPKPKKKPLPKAAPVTNTQQFARGAADPIEGTAQLLYNAIPQSVRTAGDRFNNWLADKGVPVARIPEGGLNQLVQQGEQAYQASRAAAGESGVDWMRMAGNVASPANLVAASRVPQATSMLGRVGMGAASGAGFSAMQPVTSGNDYWGDKAKQTAVGAAVGGALPAVTSGVARVVSPKASLNPDVALLRQEGVNPTIGQTLGGRWNAAEEKLQSVPIMGDAIANARGRALEQFNKAAINRATAPIGQSIDEVGQPGVSRAGDALSKAYDDAAKQLKAVQFDKSFAQDLTQLRSMSDSLLPAMKNQFERVLQQNFGKRLSQNGHMTAETFKQVDSEIGRLAREYSGSSVASERELGSAFAQFQNLMKQQAARTNPDYAKAIKAADAGWSNLVRVEGAAKAAANNSGVFTPAQLNQAIRAADDSVRKRAVARGTARMQDLGRAGQNVVGNKVPNSFTTDRLLLGGGALGSAAINPAIPASLAIGAGAYAPFMQRALSSMAASRPQSAVQAAQAVRNSTPYLAPGVIPLSYGLLGPSQ